MSEVTRPRGPFVRRGESSSAIAEVQQARSATLVLLALLASTAAARPTASPLASSPSPWLREAASAPVRWRPFDPATLAEAKRTRKPILLDVGAGWCHWCHVMDETSYADGEVIRLIGERYLAIKIDRDLSPDLDAHFQRAARRLGSNGGWPLTVWLTPDGEPYHAATYIAPQAMKELLRTLADRAAGPSSLAPEAPEAPGSLEVARPGVLSVRAAEAVGAALLRFQDRANGGIGARGPKFPDGAAIQLALALADRRGEAGELHQFATRTLDGMARGGFRDHVGGGFHRYSVDPEWRVPHFEKMSYVNAALLSAYLDGWRATRRESYREVARETVEFLLSAAGSDGTRGGFHATQDADNHPGDDGDYFTWTQAELRAAAGEEAVRFFDARAQPNDLAGVPDRNVLRAGPLHPRSLIERLRAVRAKRRAPRVDTVKYAAWNGMVIVAMLEAAAALDLPAARAAALLALDRFLARDPGMHALASDGKAASPKDEVRLDAAAWLGLAAIEAHQATGRPAYLVAARSLVTRTDRALWDPARGRYRESTSPYAPPPSIGDNATPAPSAIIALLLSRLGALTAERSCLDRAEQVLIAFASEAADAGPSASAWARAALEHTTPRIQAVIVSRRSDDPRAAVLRDAARAAWRPGHLVRSHGADAKRILPYPLGPGGAARAYVCGPSACAPPTGDPARVKELVETWER
ncbi:MAG: thioredoxin domain-containing protein [Myxococcales bacterium]|nr:thioredoxin domain-containing protein [Myxococcales bacterium]